MTKCLVIKILFASEDETQLFHLFHVPPLFHKIMA